MFVFKTKNEKKDKPKPVELEFNSPINEQMVVRMLVLEEQVAKEPTNMKIIDELCQLYSKVVEYCDSAKFDPIRRYFQEKITLVLSASVLGPKPGVPDGPRGGERVRERTPDKIDRMLKETAPVFGLAQNEDRAKEKNLKEYKEKKNRQWNFEMSKKQESEMVSKSIDKVLEQHDRQLQSDVIVKGSLQAQQNALNEKLKQRRERSFNKSLQKIGEDKKDESGVFSLSGYGSVKQKRTAAVESNPGGFGNILDEVEPPIHLSPNSVKVDNPSDENPDTKKKSVDGGSATIKYGASSMQGWRMSMEDAHISNADFDTNSALFAVFDGHGGPEVARYCEKRLGNELKNSKDYQNGNFEEALKKTFLKMDEMLVTPEGQNELRAFKDKQESENCAGCTANVVLVKDNTVYIANAGDSRSLLYKNGKVTRLSEDHKPDNEIERARITYGGGFIIDGRVNGNLNLSRAIGDLEYKKNPKLKPEEQLISAYPDVKTITLDGTESFILMGCDGVWEILSDDEICRFISDRMQNEKCLSKIIEELLDKCLAPDTTQGVGCDNMSAVLIVFK